MSQALGMNNLLTIQISNHAVERAQMRGIGPSASDKLWLAAQYGTKVGQMPWERGKRTSAVRILDRKALRAVTRAYPYLSTKEIESLNGMVVATADTGAGERIVTTTFQRFTGGTRQWYRQNERHNRKLTTKARAKRSRGLSFIDFNRCVEVQDSNEQNFATTHVSDVRDALQGLIDLQKSEIVARNVQTRSLERSTGSSSPQRYSQR